MAGQAYSLDDLQNPERPIVLDWPELQAMFLELHQPGEHVAIVGPTGRGKTWLGLELCKLIGSRKASDRRPARVTVLCYKPRDDTVRAVLPEKEWPIIRKWPPAYGDEHCIVWVRGGPPSQAHRKERAVFIPLLDRMYQEGGQTVYIPEAAHFERDLGMGRTMTKFWSDARSNKLAVISDTQRPRHVTISMWSEPSWIIIFRPKLWDDIKTVAEHSGKKIAVLEAVPQLGEREFLVVRDQNQGGSGLYVSRVSTVTRNNRNESTERTGRKWSLTGRA